MPDAAMASAAPLILASLISQLKWFHEFQPIGGVCATAGLGSAIFNAPSARAGATMKADEASIRQNGATAPTIQCRIARSLRRPDAAYGLK